MATTSWNDLLHHPIGFSFDRYDAGQGRRPRPFRDPRFHGQRPEAARKARDLLHECRKLGKLAARQGAFPNSIIGKAYAGWAGERWLDIRRIDLLAAPMRARLDKCKAKGFAAVDPDNVDGYQADTGFPLTRADTVRYFRFLAAEAHKRGLAIGLKNAAEFSTAVLPQADFAVTEDCFDQGWCRSSKNFIDAGKPVFAIEYTDNRIDFAAFCRQAKNLGLSPLLKGRSLGTWERRCL